MRVFKCSLCGAEVSIKSAGIRKTGCECGGTKKPLISKINDGAEVPCNVGLCTLRPNGEPHPAMISIYAYADEIEDKEPERADSICSIAMQLEEKLWKMAVGA